MVRRISLLPSSAKVQTAVQNIQGCFALHFLLNQAENKQ